MQNPASSPPRPPAASFRRVLRRLDLTLFSVCAILVLEGLGALASIGFSALTWTVVLLAAFFLPYGLITAELGAAYPGQGGLFVWIRRAFGDRWAARATWFYWVCVPLGLPSAYLFFAGILGRFYLPGLGLGGSVAIAVGMTWLTVLAGMLRLELGRWLPNLGALLKAALLLVLGVGGLALALQRGPANELSLRSLLPEWDAGLGLLPVVVFNFLGFELASGAGGEMRDPQRDVPAAVMTSGALIAFLYLLAALGMLLALPAAEISRLGGLVDSLAAMLGDSDGGRFWLALLGMGVLYASFATGVTWTMGTSRMAAQAAAQGDLPAVFGRRHPVHATPVGAALLTGSIATLALLVYAGLAASLDSLFWTLFAFASIVYLLPYLLLFPAFLKLRHSDPRAARPYRFPGGRVLAWGAAIGCTLIVLAAIVLFVWVPGLPVEPDLAGPVAAGTAVTLAVGEALIRRPRR